MSREAPDRIALLVLVALYTVTRLPFLYTLGFPDGDQTHTALGILDAARSGAGFHATRLYGLAVAPGFYALLFLLRPLYASEPHALFGLISGLGAAAGLGAHLFLWLALRRLWGKAAAWLVSLLWLFAPGWWEVTTFGHPSVFALCFLLASFYALTRGIRTATVVASIACFGLAVLMRADTILAGAAFPVLAWIQQRRGWRSLAVGCLVPISAFLAWAGAMPILHPLAQTGSGLGILKGFLSVLNFTSTIYRKELVILALGLGPVTALAAVAGTAGAVARRRLEPLLLAAAMGLPALIWWVHVEGPFRHMLVPALAILLAVAALAQTLSVRFAVSAAVLLSLANPLAMRLLHDRLLASYPWIYRPAPGAPRWSTRAPLDDWFSSHQAAARGVREEARWASDLSASATKRLLIVTPLPFRHEFEVLARGEPYRYRAWMESGAIWIELESGGRTYRFLEGDPPPSQAALTRAAAAGELRGFSIWIPPNAWPTAGYALPEGLPRVAMPSEAP